MAITNGAHSRPLSLLHVKKKGDKIPLFCFLPVMRNYLFSVAAEAEIAVCVLNPQELQTGVLRVVNVVAR